MQSVLLGFLNVSHINLVADSSTHRCQDTYETCAYAWENHLSDCWSIQRIQFGHHAPMLDQDLPGDIML